MKKAKNPSEVLIEFLDFLEMCQQECESAKTIVAQEDLKKGDFIHELEFESSCKKRSQIATRTHLSRKRRRAAKDTVQKYEKIVAFVSSERNKPFLKAMKGLIREQEAVENYLNNERVYYPRGGVENGNNT